MEEEHHPYPSCLCSQGRPFPPQPQPQENGECRGGMVMAEGHPCPHYHHPPPPQQPQPQPQPPGNGKIPRCMAEEEEHPYPQGYPIAKPMIPAHAAPPTSGGHGGQMEEDHSYPQQGYPIGKPMAMEPAAPANSGGGGARSVLCSFICIFLLLAGATAMTVYFVYNPRKPRFTVARAAIYDLNTSCTPFISTSMQFTVLARNPNKRVTIYYDKLSAYVSYRGQQITPAMELPSFRHRRKSTVALSPVLGGEGVMVSGEVVNGLAVDEAYGVVTMRVVLVGRLRWKAGAIKTVKYGFIVKCDVWVGLKKGFSGLAPLLEAPPCKVNV